MNRKCKETKILIVGNVRADIDLRMMDEVENLCQSEIKLKQCISVFHECQNTDGRYKFSLNSR